jgi:tetratricopeptide (TPR) repeat protein
MNAPLESLSLTIELVRSQDGADRYHFDFTAQKYERRLGPALFQESEFPWSQRVLDALHSLTRREHDPEAAQYLGDVLRAFLAPLGWDADERKLEQALKAGREVHVTLRFAAAELYALPWELITLRNSRRHLGAVEGCHLRYESPRDEESFADPAVPPGAEGRLLFAWSAAGGYVPVKEHFTAIQSACQRGPYPFDARRDVIENVSLKRLRQVLKESRESKKPVVALHLLCHGGPRGQVYGLHWDAAEPGAEPEFIDAAHLRELLAPYADSLRLVVLCACTSGDADPLARHLGGVAQGLHAIGIRAVVASRLPFSVEGSHLLAKTLYERLLVDHTSLQQALESAREELEDLTQTLDWATLQLYARQDEPLRQFPFVFRPYQGLLPFDSAHRAFFFGRGEQQREWLDHLRTADSGERPRLQVLAGPSGSGKSSLAKAALLPMLAAEGWEVVSRRPVDPGFLGDLQKLGATRPRGPRLLLVDQFEELFSRPEEEREPLARALWELSRAPEARTVILLTLRLDTLERCADLRLDDAGTVLSTIALAPRHHAFIPPFQAEQYREAIIEPAKRAGLSFQPGLVDQLLRDVGQEPGALPLLEHALDLLWERRERDTITQEAYQALGGLAGALTQIVDRLYQQLSLAEQRQMRRLLVELVDFRDDRALATRRRELVIRLRPGVPEARAAFDAVVDVLVSQRLLVRGDEPGKEVDGGWLEVAHEALIRRWGKLGEWLQEDAERVLALRTVRGWAQEWWMHRDDPEAGAGYLPFGSRLTYVRELRAKYPEDTAGSPEKEFIEAAEAADLQRDERFLQSVRIANRLLVDIEGLEGVAGMEEHRRSLLEQVEQMLDNLIHSAGTRPIALEARSVACLELGNVALDQGDWDHAHKMYAQAMTLSRELYARAPSTSKREYLAVSLNKLGLLARRRGELDQTHVHNEEALRIIQALSEEQPGEVRLQIELARALQHLGEALIDRNELDFAQTRLDAALALLQQHISAGASHPKLQPRLASCLHALGELAAARGTSDVAEQYYRAALDTLERLYGETQANSRVRLMFAKLYSKLGGIAFHQKDIFEARRRHLNALHLLEALAQAQPRSMRILRGLAISLRSMGEVQIAAGELEEARFYLGYAQSKLETLVSRTTDHTEHLVDQLRTMIELGRVAKALGDLPAHTAHQASAAQLLATLEDRKVPKARVGELREKLTRLREP